MHDADDYQERHYKPATWISLNTTSTTLEVGIVKATTAFSRYAKGKNEQEVKFNLTTPLVTLLATTGEGGYDVSKNMTHAMYLPRDLQEKPPTPTSDDLFLVEVPARTVFVREFGGFATEGTFKKQHAKLRDALVAANEEFVDCGFVAAVYDMPSVLTNRHNEVWLMRKEGHVAAV